MRGNGPIEEFEAQVSDEIAQLVSTNELGVGVRWTARILLLGAGRQAPGDWMQSAFTQVIEPEGSDEPNITLRAGWGNGVVEGWDQAAPSVRTAIAMGVVDAQAIWTDLTILNDSTLEAGTQIFAPQAELSRREITDNRTTVMSVSARIARHNLIRDEISFDLQGLRRRTGEALLTAWRHDDAVSRLSRRVTEMGDCLDRQHQRRQEKYQGAVEAVLLTLGLMTIIDVTVAVVALAFSNTDRAPGDPSPLHVLGTIRSTNADYLIVVSVAAVLALVTALWRRSRR